MHQGVFRLPHTAAVLHEVFLLSIAHAPGKKSCMHDAEEPSQFQLQAAEIHSKTDEYSPVTKF